MLRDVPPIDMSVDGNARWMGSPSKIGDGALCQDIGEERGSSQIKSDSASPRQGHANIRIWRQKPLGTNH
jgi:hypothetical protein